MDRFSYGNPEIGYVGVQPGAEFDDWHVISAELFNKFRGKG